MDLRHDDGVPHMKNKTKIKSTRLLYIRSVVSRDIFYIYYTSPCTTPNQTWMDHSNTVNTNEYRPALGSGAISFASNPPPPFSPPPSDTPHSPPILPTTQLVGAVCRPPRDTYDETDLVGGRRAAFMFGESRPTIKKYYRQDVELRNPRGQKLQCSHYRPCIVTSSDGRLPCCIYCHTNSGSRRDAEEILFHLLPHGITVFSLDFSGSGLSEGEWVTLGALEVEDLATAVAYLRDEGSTSTLAIWGRSMGAVTALLYSHRDPSIAGVVADSSFSRLTDLMLELATNENGASVATGGFSVPKPLVKVALTMIKRSVRRRAEFNIDHVAPLERVPETYVPTLFGHAKGDTFVAPHHSERLFVAHGADTKNFISFEGDHNDMRPEFWYDSALIFLLGVLRVEELVGPDLDLLGHDGDGGGGGGGIRFPHLYVSIVSY